MSDMARSGRRLRAALGALGFASLLCGCVELPKPRKTATGGAYPVLAPLTSLPAGVATPPEQTIAATEARAADLQARAAQLRESDG